VTPLFYSPSLPSRELEGTNLALRDLEQPENPILRLALLEQMGIKGGYKVRGDSTIQHHTAAVGMSNVSVQICIRAD